MAIDTRYVGGRRKVRLTSYDDLLDEAEKLLAADVRTLGNWTVGQTLAHLAEVMHMSVDGAPYRASFLQRLTVGSLQRRRWLVGPQPAGFQLSPEAEEVLVPAALAAPEGYAALRRAVHRVRVETDVAQHPLFGWFTPEQWEQYHLRHAELHLSFLLPLADTVVLPRDRATGELHKVR